MKLETLLNLGRKIIPPELFRRLSPLYHYLLVFLAALVYRFPTRKIFVAGVTGTKGKTSVLEIINAILEEAGHKTALISTLRFKIGKSSCRNSLKMTMPGRFFLQKFLRSAVKRKCQFVLMEMTSQGVLQSRHKFIGLNAMIFTNLSPEHIESHGSFEKYRGAKLQLFKTLQESGKKNKTSIINGDDENAEYFLKFNVDNTWVFRLNKHDAKNETASVKELRVTSYELHEHGIDFVIGNKTFTSGLLGKFNLYNILAAISFARSQKIEWETIAKALEKIRGIPGRMEIIEEARNFKVVIDYAHTPESLEEVYGFFGDSRKICVLGAAGGGRDKWKRKEMGAIAADNCAEIILTNEDPYDEKPLSIIKNIAEGIKHPFKYKLIPDRREAIREALKTARTGDTVIITGKGTDPWIMGPYGTKIKWDDREVTREELKHRSK